MWLITQDTGGRQLGTETLFSDEKRFVDGAWGWGVMTKGLFGQLQGKENTIKVNLFSDRKAWLTPLLHMFRKEWSSNGLGSVNDGFLRYSAVRWFRRGVSLVYLYRERILKLSALFFFFCDVLQ